MWKRGDPADPAAIAAIRAFCADTPVPAFLEGPSGADLRCYLDPEFAEAAADLVCDEYWNQGIPRAKLVQSHRRAVAWVGAVNDENQLIATARAIGDWAKHANILDVAVAPRFRGSGIGQAVMKLLLDHPAVRHCDRVWLRTKDAHGFYRRFGFGHQHRTADCGTEMVMQRGGEEAGSVDTDAPMPPAPQGEAGPVENIA